MNHNQIAALIGIAIFVIGSLILYFFKDKQTEEPLKWKNCCADLVGFQAYCLFSFSYTICRRAIKELFNSEMSLNIFFSSVFLFLMAACFVWVGIYGQGWERYQLKDDKALHKKNKERYKWRWWHNKLLLVPTLLRTQEHKWECIRNSFQLDSNKYMYSLYLYLSSIGAYHASHQHKIIQERAKPGRPHSKALPIRWDWWSGHPAAGQCRYHHA